MDYFKHTVRVNYLGGEFEAPLFASNSSQQKLTTRPLQIVFSGKKVKRLWYSKVNSTDKLTDTEIQTVLVNGVRKMDTHSLSTMEEKFLHGAKRALIIVKENGSILKSLWNTVKSFVRTDEEEIQNFVPKCGHILVLSHEQFQLLENSHSSEFKISVPLDDITVERILHDMTHCDLLQMEEYFNTLCQGSLEETNKVENLDENISLDLYATGMNLPWILALEMRRTKGNSSNTVHESIAHMFRKIVLVGEWDVDSCIRFSKWVNENCKKKKRGTQIKISQLLLSFINLERLLNEKDCAQLLMFLLVVHQQQSLCPFVEALNKKYEEIQQRNKSESLLAPQQVVKIYPLVQERISDMFLQSEGPSEVFFYRIADEILRYDQANNLLYVEQLFHPNKAVFKKVITTSKEVIHASLTEPVIKVLRMAIENWIRDWDPADFKEVCRIKITAYIWEYKADIDMKLFQSFKGLLNDLRSYSRVSQVSDALDLLENAVKCNLRPFENIMTCFNELLCITFPVVVSHYSHPFMQHLSDTITMDSFKDLPVMLLSETLVLLKGDRLSDENKLVLELFAKVLSAKVSDDSHKHEIKYSNRHSLAAKYFFETFLNNVFHVVHDEAIFRNPQTLVEYLSKGAFNASNGTLSFYLCEHYVSSLKKDNSESIKLLEESVGKLQYRTYITLRDFFSASDVEKEVKNLRSRSQLFDFLRRVKEKCQNDFRWLSNENTIDECITVVEEIHRTGFFDEDLFLRMFHVDDDFLQAHLSTGPHDRSGGWKTCSLYHLNNLVDVSNPFLSNINRSSAQSLFHALIFPSEKNEDAASTLLRQFLKEEIQGYSQAISKPFDLLKDGFNSAMERAKSLLTSITMLTISYKELMSLKTIFSDRFHAEIRRLESVMKAVGSYTSDHEEGVLYIIEDVESRFCFFQHVTTLFIPQEGDKTVFDQFDFKCRDDPKVHQLINTIQNGFLPDGPIQKLVDLTNEIQTYFYTYWSINTATKLCFLLSHLPNMKNQWSFFQQNSVFLAQEHIGYSVTFDERLEELISQAPRQKTTVLQNFKYSSFFICALLHQTGTATFMDLTRWLWSVDRLSEVFQKKEESVVQNSFPLVSIMENVDKEMDVISELIHRGLNQLEMVKYQFDSVRCNGFSYYFNVETMEEMMEFSENVKFRMHLNAEQIHDFVRRLEFAACDPDMKHEMPQEDVAEFLKLMEQYGKSLTTIAHLRSLGHPDFLPAKRVVTTEKDISHIDFSFTPLQPSLLGNLNNTVTEWKNIIKGKMESNRLMALLSIPAALALGSSIQKGDVFETLVVLSPLFANDVQKENDVQEEITALFSHQNSISSISDCSLLDIADDFIKALSLSLKWNIGQEDKMNSLLKGCQLFQCHDEHEVCVALEEIYDDRSPYSFEVLWCTSDLYFLAIEQALQRAKLFPNFRFSFVHSDLLPYAAQTTIIQALCEEGVSNLFFIEQSGSMIRAAYKFHIINNMVKPLSYTFTQLSTVRCYVGDSGSGKSYQIHKHIGCHQKQDTKISCVLVLTEDIALDVVVTRVLAVVQQCLAHQRDMILAIQFSVGCYTFESKNKWLSLCAVLNKLLIQLLMMRSILDGSTGRLIFIPRRVKVELLLELPGDFLFEVGDVLGWFPLLQNNSFCSVVNARDLPFDMDEDAHFVARYLKAYEDKVIDELYDSNGGAVDVLFVQDISGSMTGEKLEDSKASIIDIISLLSDHSRAGVLLFNNNLLYLHQIGYCSSSNNNELKEKIRNTTAFGKTSMWAAIENGLNILSSNRRENIPQFLTVLSDGASDHYREEECEQQLRHATGVGIIFIGVELSEKYIEKVERICLRTSVDKVIHLSNSNGIRTAFEKVGQHLTVNQRIINHTISMSEEQVRHYILHHMKPDSHPNWSRLQMAQWVRYMSRRCNILASSSTFDKNKDKPRYGSVTMEMMLIQAEQAVDKNHVKWAEKAHEHMAYRRNFIVDLQGKQVEDYQWSFIAVNLSEMEEAEEIKRRKMLEKLHMCLPTGEDLKDRRVLESYLAYSVGATLKNPKEELSSSGLKYDFPLGELAALDEQKFVLTADSLMKMLMINERIECNVPCIMMGETGVSKTKLTQMLFHIKNHQFWKCDGLVRRLNAAYWEDGETPILHARNICQTLTISIPDSLMIIEGKDKNTYLELVCEHVVSESFKNSSEREKLCEILLDVFRQDPSLDPLHDLTIENLANMRDNVSYPLNVLLWCLKQNPSQRRVEQRSWMFHPVCIDSSLRANEIRRITEISAVRAHHLELLAETLPNFHFHKAAQICIFYDEFNTSSYMGVLKEIILDRRMSGQPLPKKLVPVAACNPYRRRMEILVDCERARETGVDWVSGHYNVHPLPRSLHDMTWDYGSLLRSQEREFIQKRLDYERITATAEEKENIVNAVLTAHCKTRDLAERHVQEMRCKNRGTASIDSTENAEEQIRRSSSVVSVRDILRFFRMFKYFHSGLPSGAKDLLFPGRTEKQIMKDATALAVAAVYYFRLGENAGSIDYRKLFRQEMKRIDGMDIEDTVSKCMNRVMAYTKIPSHVVGIQSLKENLFMILCSVTSRTPLIVKGPPGTSKTLSIQLMCDNAKGFYSDMELFKCFPSMVSFHYQCSRLSTSKEISEVFERAIAEQKKSDEQRMNKLFFVFMDEAGLPEEERESLKVLHYYLEDNSERGTDVGFVAITNQLLDAANTNRCNILSRGHYDLEALKALAKGCLEGTPAPLRTTAITREGKALTGTELVQIIASGFESFMESSRQSLFDSETVNHPITKRRSPKESENFFGLRDFMHLFKRLKLIKLKKSETLTIKDLFRAAEHSFNGLEKWKVRHFIMFLLSCLDGAKTQIRKLHDPIQLLEESVQASGKTAGPPQLRYLLVVDTTSSDGVLHEIVNLLGRRIRMTKLSNFQDDHDQQQVKAVAEVCYSAEQGYLVGLSNARAIYDSLYDLFNQHFRVYEDHMKSPPEIMLYTNIAVSGHSQRCRVSPRFYCMVFMNETELSCTPAPFLDRLEKYRIGMSDILHRYLTRSDSSISIVLKRMVKPLLASMEKWLDGVGWESFYGVKRNQTLESLILWWLRTWENRECIKLAIKEYKSDYPSFSLPDDLDPVKVLEKNMFKNEHVEVLFLVAQYVLMKKLLLLAIPEKVLNSIPPSIQQLYLRERNFSIHLEASENGSRELILTRNASHDYVRTLIEQYPTCRFIDFSSYDRAVDFRRDLSQYWGLQQHIFIRFSLPRSGISQLNYLRFQINQEFARCSKQSVTVVATVSAVDTAVHHMFDTIFSIDWNLRFLDSLHFSIMLPWMKWGYEDITQSSKGYVENIMHRCLVQSVYQLAGLIECVPHSLSKDTKRFYICPDDILKLLEIKVTSDHSMTLSHFIIKQFIMRWSNSKSQNCDNDGFHTYISAFRKHIQDIVEFQRVDQRTTCLAETINEELMSLLIADILMVVCELIPLLGPNYCSSSTTSVEVMTTLLKCLFCSQSLNVPQIMSFGGLRKTKVSLLAFPGFPLYKEVHRLLSSLVEREMNKEKHSSSISMIVEGIKQMIKEKSSPAAQIIQSSLLKLKTDDPLFNVYLDNFVADLFPHMNESTRKVAKFLLLSDMEEDSAIVALHVNYNLLSENLLYYVQLFSSVEGVTVNIEEVQEKIVGGADPEDLVNDECCDALIRCLSGDSVAHNLIMWIACIQKALMLSYSPEHCSPKKKLILTFFHLCKSIFYCNSIPQGSDECKQIDAFLRDFFSRISSVLLSPEHKPPKQPLEETLIAVLDQYHINDALFYVARLPPSIRDGCILDRVEEKKKISPFVVEQEIQRILFSKEDCYSFSSVGLVLDHFLEDEKLNTALHQAGVDSYKISCYLDSCIMQTMENNSGEGHFLVQSYFCAIWNLLMEWHGNKTTLNDLCIVVDDFSRKQKHKTLVSCITLEVWKKCFVDLLAESLNSGGDDFGVLRYTPAFQNCLDLSFQDDRWIHWFVEQIKNRDLFDSIIVSYMTKDDSFTSFLKNAQKIIELRLQDPNLKFHPLQKIMHQSSLYQRAEIIFPNEMQAVSYLRDMWMIPLLWDLYEWAGRQDEEQYIYEAMETSEKTILREWTVVERWLNAHEDTLKLNPREKVRSLISHQMKDGKTEPGKLYSMISVVMANFQSVIEAYGAEGISDSRIRIGSLEDLWNYVFSEYAEAHRSTALNDALQVDQCISSIESLKHKFQLYSPVATSLRSFYDWNDIYSSDESNNWALNINVIRNELHDIISHNIVIVPEHLWSMRVVFQGGMQSSLEQPNKKLFQAMFHQLNFYRLQSCVKLLEMAFNAASHPTDTFKSIMEQWVDGDIHEWIVQHFEISMDESSWLLAFDTETVREAIQYLKEQLERRTFLFSEKPLHLKEEWPEEVDHALGELLENEWNSARMNSLHELQNFLIQQEDRIQKDALSFISRELCPMNNTKNGMIEVLANGTSLLQLFVKYPLLRRMKDLQVNEQPFILRSSYYIAFRLKLFLFLEGKREKETVSAVHQPDSIFSLSEESIDAFDFLMAEDGDNGAIHEEETNENDYENLSRSENCSTTLPEVNQSRFERRKPFGAIRANGIQSIRVTSRQKQRLTEERSKKILAAIETFDGSENSAKHLCDTLEEMVGESPVCTRARLILEEHEKKQKECNELIRTVFRSRQANVNELAAAVQFLVKAGDNGEDVRRGKELLHGLNMIKKNAEFLSKGILTFLDQRLIPEGFTLTSSEFSSKDIAEHCRRFDLFSKALLRYWGVADGDQDLLSVFFAHTRKTETSFLDEQDVQELIPFILPKEKLLPTQIIRNCYEMEKKSEKDPLAQMPERELLLALSFSQCTEAARLNDAIHYLREYVKKVREGVSRPHVLVILATARILRRDSRYPGAATLCSDAFQLCVSEESLREHLNAEEDGIGRNTRGTIMLEKEKGQSEVDAIHKEWEELVNANGRQLSFGDGLMKMVGLNNVKREILSIYQNIQSEQNLPPERRLAETYHFLFLGNPGTGKTTVAKLLGNMLFELGVRTKKVFVEVTGAELVRKGVDEAIKIFKRAENGVLFIDEAYGLDASGIGKGIALELLDIAEKSRETLTIILAGYTHEMQEKLLNVNPGFSSRFPFRIVFEDYNEKQLREIFLQFCTEKKWKVDTDAADIAGRRLGKASGRPGFGNARDARNLFEKAHRRSRNRDSKAEFIKTVDILGPRPNRGSIPDLDAAMTELENMVGLDLVKKRIMDLIFLAESNYDREIMGQPTDAVTLNRVFLGNPGTGKTTVAKLYGRILNGMGYLSKGNCELKQAKDFVGQHVGESEQKTSAMIEQCKGGVLLIDEAYALSTSPYGKAAIDTIVSMVHGSPSEDIAVVLIGYDKQMKEMFREVNPGLKDRFQLSEAFVFEDYDDPLLDIAISEQLSQRGIRVSPQVREAMLGELQYQRCLPHFGNMRAVFNLVNGSVARMRRRNPQSSELLLEDLDSPQQEDVGQTVRKAFSELFNVEYIIQAFERLENILLEAAKEKLPKEKYIKNYVFVGPPGTGKSTVARVMAKVLFRVRAISRNVLVEKTGQDLQGSYIGQTKDVVNKAMAEAQGGVLFIDEAYTLGKGFYSTEVVDQLIALMTSPEHLHKTVVVLAGYEEEVNEMLQSNSGLRSRFTETIRFLPWSSDDCIDFLHRQMLEEKYVIEGSEVVALKAVLERLISRSDWGNARDCETTFTKLKEARWTRQSLSLIPKTERVFTREDVDQVRVFWEQERRPDDDKKWILPPSHRARIPQSLLHQRHADPVFNEKPPSPLKKEHHYPKKTSQNESPGCNVREVEPEDDPLLIELLLACRTAGYDSTHERRIDLIAILHDAQNGGVFPDDILGPIRIAFSNETDDAIMRTLRPQIPQVLHSMEKAVEEEEKIRQIRNEKERKERQKEIAHIQLKIRQRGLCPQGFDWHREGTGWRCNGGSHWISGTELE